MEVTICVVRLLTQTNNNALYIIYSKYITFTWKGILELIQMASTLYFSWSRIEFKIIMLVEWSQWPYEFIPYKPNVSIKFSTFIMRPKYRFRIKGVEISIVNIFIVFILFVKDIAFLLFFLISVKLFKLLDLYLIIPTIYIQVPYLYVNYKFKYLK